MTAERSRPPWQPCTRDQLEAADLEAVIEGRSPALLVRGFLSAERRRLTLAALESERLNDYGGSLKEHFRHLGVPRVEYLEREDGKSAYFADAAAFAPRLKRIFDESGDLIESLLGSLARIWPARVGVAFEPAEGSFYSAGVIRQVLSGLPHVDWPAMDGDDWSVAREENQLAFNIFLQIDGSAGGETVVYRREWTPELEETCEPGTYWYPSEAIDGVERAVARPEAGDLLVFSTRNVHEVRPVEEGALERLTLSVFCSVSPGSHELMLFS